MTIAGWFVFVFLSSVIAGLGIAIFLTAEKTGKISTIIVVILMIGGLFGGLRYYFTSTAAGQRKMIDQRSSLGSGLERTVRIYTANGDVIAEYFGQIDLEANDGGYIKFDLDGKRYIYYNCFVESIAEIE